MRFITTFFGIPGCNPVAALAPLYGR